MAVKQLCFQITFGLALYFIAGETCLVVKKKYSSLWYLINNLLVSYQERNEKILSHIMFYNPRYDGIKTGKTMSRELKLT